MGVCFTIKMCAYSLEPTHKNNKIITNKTYIYGYTSTYCLYPSFPFPLLS